MNTTYTPQLNGISERRNRRIQEMARAMLNEKKLPQNFWADAVLTAVYLQNRCSAAALNGVTPFEVMSGRNSRVKHLRVFGCIGYTHIPTERRKKMDNPGKVCIFLGYGLMEKGYRMLDIL